MIDAPQLSKLSTFDTRHLDTKVDISRFGELDFDESLNTRDNSTETAKYLKQEFMKNQGSAEQGLEAYQALSAYQREKLSYSQYNDQNLRQFISDISIPLRNNPLSHT